PPPPPPCIDDFDIGQELGKGGFAVVYRARVRVSGLEVALKVVDKHRASKYLSGVNASGGEGGDGGGGGVELACARVANEVRLHWGLKHPTVVELLEFFEDERFVYMVLELCGGGDLYRRLKERGPLGEEEAAGYMGQLLAGVGYLHDRGVMHRDLKLSNLLLSEDGRRLRIGDFGLAVKLEDEDHERYTICGTPNYMAPEVQGCGYSLSADLWSAGCLFYTMVTGAAPFQGRRVGDTLANARAGRYAEPEGLSAVAKDFLACMLSLDPARRMRVEEAAAHPFLRLDKKRPQRHLRSASIGAMRREKVSTTTTATTVTTSSRSRSGTGEKLRSSDVDKAAFSKGGKGSGSGGRRKSVTPPCAKRGGRVLPLASPGGDSVISKAKGRGMGGGGSAGHSTLTASTTIIGSDRCSINSSLLGGGGGGEDGASFSTLRADAVPTPAAIGVGAAAAAARARRAAARAPFRATAEGTTAAARVRAAAAASAGGGGDGGGGGGGGRGGAERTKYVRGVHGVGGAGGVGGSGSGGGVGGGGGGGAVSPRWRAVQSPVGRSRSSAGRDTERRKQNSPSVERSGGGAGAAAEVFPDGRASITVGKRWLMASGNGQRVWVGSLGTGGCSSSEASASVGGGRRDARPRALGRTEAGVGVGVEAGARKAAFLAAGTVGSADAGYSLRSLPEAFHPLYKSLAGIVHALRTKTPKVVVRCGEQGGGSGGARRGELVLCALMDNLPDPDFAAAFDDGASLSLWTSKNELRVELPSGRVCSWPVAPGDEWPTTSARSGGGGGGGEGGCFGGGGGGGGGGAGRRVEGAGDYEDEEGYLRAGLEGYCNCLREEAAAYRRGASFPVDLVVAAAAVTNTLVGSESSQDEDLRAFGTFGGGDGGRAKDKGKDEDVGWERTAARDERASERRLATGDQCRDTAAAGWKIDEAQHAGRRNDQRQQHEQQQQQQRQQHQQQRQQKQQEQEQSWQQARPTKPLHRPPPAPSADRTRPQPAPMSDGAIPAPAAPRSQVEDAPAPQVSNRDYRAAETPETAQGRHRNGGGSRGAGDGGRVGSDGGGGGGGSGGSGGGGGSGGSGSDGEKLPRSRRPTPETCSLTCSSTSEDWKPRAVGQGRSQGQSGSCWEGGGSSGGGGGRDVSRSKGCGLEGAERGAAVIPGLGEALRDGDGNLEVRFADGVVVTVDAKAKWMRVERPILLPAQSMSSSRDDTTSRTTAVTQKTQQTTTYDLGRPIAKRGSADGGSGGVGDSGQRMPRDVKDRMKALPRFIDILK
ncbi:unnamed protein product, partial [Laminaria digitata]